MVSLEHGLSSECHSPCQSSPGTRNNSHRIRHYRCLWRIKLPYIAHTGLRGILVKLVGLVVGKSAGEVNESRRAKMGELERLDSRTHCSLNHCGDDVIRNLSKAAMYFIFGKFSLVFSLVLQDAIMIASQQWKRWNILKRHVTSL